VAPSVTEIIPTRLTDVPSNMYNYSFSCTIDPESSADTCEVTLRNGDITKMGMYAYVAVCKVYGCTCIKLM